MLDKWFDANLSIADAPLVLEIYDLLKQLFIARFSPSSRQMMLEKLRALCGQYDSSGRLQPTTLPLTHPTPSISFANKRFCFTGTFKYGTRNMCKQAVRDLGGSVGLISTLTDYLVVGSRATEAWMHASYGTKIASAVH
jgi:NAD-dependent DNA ligase